MPQIKEYTQKVGSEAGYSTLSVNPSIEGASGRAMQQAGAAISDVGNMLMDIQGAKEASDAAAKNSELLKNQTIKLNEQLKTGQLDLEKFNQELDAEIEQNSQGFITRYGEEKYRNSASSIKNSLSMDAYKAKAEITSVTIKNNALKLTDNYRQLLMINPTKRDEVKSSYANDIRATTVDGKLIDAKVAEKIISEGHKDLDVAQFRGLIRLQPDVKSLKGLYDSLRGGAFLDRDFSDPNQKMLEREIREEISLKESLNAENERRSKKATDERDKVFLEGIVRKIEDGTITDKDFLDAREKGMSWDAREKGRDIWKKSLSREVATNDSYEARKLFSSIVSGEDVTVDDLTGSYIDGKIKKETMNSLIKQLNILNRPEVAPYKQQVSGLRKYAEGKLKKDPLYGQDPEGDRQVQMFLSEMTSTMQKKLSEGVPMSELLDSTGASKDSLYNLVPKYKRSGEEIINSTLSSIGGDAPKAARPKTKLPDGSEKEMSDDDIIKKINAGEL